MRDGLPVERDHEVTGAQAGAIRRRPRIDVRDEHLGVLEPGVGLADERGIDLRLGDQVGEARAE